MVVMSTHGSVVFESRSAKDCDPAILLRGLEADHSLLRPHALHRRLRALDDLDAAFGDTDTEGSPVSAVRGRAQWLRSRLERLNGELYCLIRQEIANGGPPDQFLKWLVWPEASNAGNPRPGSAFDAEDELVSCVLQLQEPGDPEPGSSEMVPYQPTPVRHILDLIRLARPRPDDVLIDLGSGLGHVPLVVSILTGIRTRGIEVQPVYSSCAQDCAQGLHLSQVSFITGDARAADLSEGTLYYLYSPFNGSILANVLERLSKESARRSIRLCSLGPVTSTLAREPWLRASAGLDRGRVAVFETR